MVKSENLVFEKQLEKNKQQLRTGVFFFIYFFLMNSSRMHTGRNMEVNGIKFTNKILYYKPFILGKFSAMWRVTVDTSRSTERVEFVFLSCCSFLSSDE